MNDVLFLRPPPAPRSTPFPYTTLFRSMEETRRIIDTYGNHPSFVMMAYGNEPSGNYVAYLEDWVDHFRAYDNRFLYRSEEHTSELQSRPHLVCRLLLETKNTTSDITYV